MTETPLKQFMETTGCTQVWLAKQLGVTQPTIHRWLKTSADLHIVQSDDGTLAYYEKRWGKAS